LFVGGLFSVNAADMIILKDGNVIEAKIMEIHPAEIRYKRADNLNGPMIILPKDGVLSIRYENGVLEIINASPAEGQGGQTVGVGSSGGPQMGTQTPLQIILNTLPAIRIAGNNLKFQFGGDKWISTVNGENFSAGTVELEYTGGGTILTLKQTHIWPGAVGKTAGRIFNRIPGGGTVGGTLNAAGNIAGAAGAVEASGPVIVLEYKAGPPAKLSYLKSASERSTKAAAATVLTNAIFRFAGGEIQGFATRAAARVENLVIPDTIGGVPVTSIGDRAFRDDRLTGVTVPDSVTHIGYEAFWANRLTSVIIPGSVTYIGGSAFRYNRLTGVTIPDSVTYIGESAFRDNSLTDITIGNKVTYIGGSAFRGNQMTSVTIPDSVTYIGESALCNNRLTSVTIPDSVTYIGEWAFRYNRLTSVTIPDSVTSIGELAFSDNELTAVTIGANVRLATSSFPNDFERVYNNNGRTAGTYSTSTYGLWIKVD
jgi:hypothetical protein